MIQKGDSIRIKNNGGWGVVDSISPTDHTIRVGFPDGQILAYAETDIELDWVQTLIQNWRNDGLRPISPQNVQYMKGYTDALCKYGKFGVNVREEIYRYLGIG